MLVRGAASHGRQSGQGADHATDRANCFTALLRVLALVALALGGGCGGDPAEAGGLVTAGEPGTTTVQASAGTLADTATVTVEPGPRAALYKVYRTMGGGGGRSTGAFPREIGNLASLTNLYVMRTELTGSLPRELIGLPLDEFHWIWTDLRAPNDDAFQNWPKSIPDNWPAGKL